MLPEEVLEAYRVGDATNGELVIALEQLGVGPSVIELVEDIVEQAMDQARMRRVARNKLEDMRKRPHKVTSKEAWVGILATILDVQGFPGHRFQTEVGDLTGVATTEWKLTVLAKAEAILIGGEEK